MESVVTFLQDVVPQVSVFVASEIVVFTRELLKCSVS